MNSTKAQSIISVSYHSMAIKRKQIIAIVPILFQKNSTFRPHLVRWWNITRDIYNEYSTIGHSISECNSIFRNVGIKRLFTLSWPKTRIFLPWNVFYIFFFILCIEKVFSCRKLDLMQICNLDVKREECCRIKVSPEDIKML